MATAIGTNTVTSLARQYIIPEITDNIYGSNVLFFRLNAANKKSVQGGTQIEVPLMYQRFSAGGPYQGFDVLDVAPSDTIKNGALDWKQYYVPVSIDGLTLVKVDSPLAIANTIKVQFEQAQMEMAEWLGTGLYTDGTTNTKHIDGLKGAVDETSVLTTYAGISRTSNTWWKCQIDSSTATMTMAALNTFYGLCGKGGRKSTLIVSRQEQYNRFWALNQTLQRYISGEGDAQLAQAGFQNLVLNGTPWVVDDHVFDGPNSSNSAILFLDEAYIDLAVSPRGDFYMEDFQTPVNQDAMTAKLLWAGNLIVKNVARQGKMTALTA